MKLDNMVQTFFERVDPEAVEMIDELAAERGFAIHERTKPVKELTNTFTEFCNFLDGYGTYKIRFRTDPNASPDSAILESAKNMVRNNPKMFAEAAIPYAEIPAYIQSYLEGIQQLQGVIEKTKGRMLMEEVNPDSIGLIDGMVDVFTERLQEEFDPWIEKMLVECGYRARKRLAPKPIVKKAEPVFL